MEAVSWLYYSIAFLSCALVTLYVYFKFAFQYWEKKGVRYLKPVIPYGTYKDMILMRKTFGDMYEDQYWALRGEKFGGLYMSFTPQLLVRDPELIKQVLVKHFDNFHDHSFASDPSVDPLSGNLFMLKGQKWNDMRNKLSPTFTSGKMKMMFETLAECGIQLQDCLKKSAENEEIFEVKDIMSRYTTDIIASVAFGIQCNCLKDPNAEFAYWVKRITEMDIDAIIRNLLFLLVPSIALALKLSRTPRDIRNFFYRLVEETVGFREKHSITRKDILQLLIQLRNKMGISEHEKTVSDNGLTMDEITAQVFVFFIAGFETSATTMTFCLYELALNPDIQDRLRKEIDTVLGKDNGKVTYDAIQEMQYLDKVVAETLRKHSPVPFLSRECTRDFKLPDTNVTLEKGSQIVIPIQALHYDPEYFPDPEKFDPERFREEVQNKRHHYVYLPFGEGPRLCIGMRFAMMQIKVGLVSLLNNYQFNVCDKTSIPLKIDTKPLIKTAEGGIWLQIKKRDVKT